MVLGLIIIVRIRRARILKISGRES